VSDYRIDKLRRRVAVTLANGRRIDGDVFLQVVARFRPGPEDPLDLLNGSERFLPVVLDSGEALLVQKSHIAVVSTPLPPDDDAVDHGVVGMHVELTLADGSAWTGSIFPEVRVDRTRLVDFLNDTPLRFIALFAPDQLLAVSRRHLSFARTVG
jgi:hypothetical protein